MTLSDHIGERENLGRSVFSSKHRDRARRARTPYHVFLEREGIIKISVDRLDPAPPADATAIAVRIANERGPAISFYGWAVVMAHKAGVNGRHVRASPKPDNPYHADIVLPDPVAEDREEQKRHAQELADASSWRERPSASGADQP